MRRMGHLVTAQQRQVQKQRVHRYGRDKGFQRDQFVIEGRGVIDLGLDPHGVDQRHLPHLDPIHAVQRLPLAIVWRQGNHITRADIHHRRRQRQTYPFACHTRLCQPAFSCLVPLRPGERHIEL